MYEEIDKNSVVAVSGLMVENGYDVSATEGICDVFDLVAVKGDVPPVYIEVKNRRVAHDAYPDMRVDANKLDAAEKAVESGKCRGVLVASVYTDGYICLGNIRRGKRTTGYGPLATMSPIWTHRNGVYATKEFVDVPRELCYKKTDGSWRVVQ